MHQLQTQQTRKLTQLIMALFIAQVQASVTY